MKKAILLLSLMMLPSMPGANEVIQIQETELVAGVPKYSYEHKLVKKIEYEFIGNYELTAYCPCSSCSDGWGWQTSTGKECVEGRTIAVDPRVIPYGSVVKIEGLGEYVAEDCGGAINGNRIDVFIADHSRCLDFGRFKADVYLKKE